jgi:hypothetical protein
VDIAIEARVSKGYAHKVLNELLLYGSIDDPSLMLAQWYDRRTGTSELRPEASLYLLLAALTTEDDQTPLYKYSQILWEDLGIKISHQTINVFFKKRGRCGSRALSLSTRGTKRIRIMIYRNSHPKSKNYFWKRKPIYRVVVY